MRALAATLGLACALAAQTPVPADFYVAPGGSDTAAGTISAPFATVNRARQAVQALLRANPARNTAVLVHLRGGTYYMTAPLAFTSADSGTATAPVIYQAMPGERPVLSGAVRLSDWNTTLPAATQNFANLYINGQRRYRPRTTRNAYLRNAGTITILTLLPEPNCARAGVCADRFRFAPGDLASSYANINDVEVINFETQGASRQRLQSVDTAGNIAFLTGPTLQEAGRGWISGHRYLVENVKEALSQAGEWYLDRGTSPWTLTYLPKSGEDLATAVVEVPQLPQLMIVAGASNITFSGLTFAHDNWTVPALGYPSNANEERAPAAVTISGGSVVVDGCTITHTAAWALEVQGGSKHQINNNLFYDLGAGGIRVSGGTQELSLQSNMVNSGGRFLPGAPGILIGDATNTTVTKNEISDFYQSGIVDSGRASTLSFNRIRQIGQGVTNDMGGVRVAGSAAQILNNRISDVNHATQDTDGFGGWGIVLDGTSGATVRSNTVYRASATTIHSNRATESAISNNVLAYGGAGLIQHNRPASNAQSFQFTGNVGVFTNNVQRSPSEWYCFDTNGIGTACPPRFLFDSNQYFSTVNPNLSFFQNTDLQTTSRIVTHTLAQWRALGEDVKSQVGNPLLANATFPADDFRVTSTSPAIALGFTPFDPALADRFAPVLHPTPVDPAFPVRPLDPVTDYRQAATTVTAASTVNSASFRGGSVAANSMASVFGSALATGTLVAPPAGNLPLALGGTSVTVRDSAGVSRAAPLYFVATGQINYVVPAGSAGGTAAVTVVAPGGVATGSIAITSAAPGLFSADGSGRGTAAAVITTVRANGTSDFVVAAAGPIDVSNPEEQVFCTLYGTGIRNRSSLDNVSIQVGNQTLRALYAGAQPSFEGFDQVNFLLPRTLAGRGTVTLTLSADNATSNSVTLTFR